jgi:hypothetical protein
MRTNNKSKKEGKESEKDFKKLHEKKRRTGRQKSEK